MASLTPLSKGLITVLVLGAVGAGIYTQKDKLFPPAPVQPASIPPNADLPDDTGNGQAGAARATPVTLNSAPGCADKPEVRFYHWAWNAQIRPDAGHRRQAGRRGQPDVQARRQPQAHPRGQRRPDAVPDAELRRAARGRREEPGRGRALRRDHGRRLGRVLQGAQRSPEEARPRLHGRDRGLGRLQPRRGQVHGPAGVEGQPAGCPRRPGRRLPARRRLEHRHEVARRQPDPQQPGRDHLRPRRAQLGQRVRLHRRRPEVRHRLLHRAQEHQDQQEGRALHRRRGHLDPG